MGEVKLSEAQRRVLRWASAPGGLHEEVIHGAEWKTVRWLENRGLVAERPEPDFQASYFATEDGRAALASSKGEGE